jgi:hypothetical protein
MRQSRPKATSRWGLQVQGPFNKSIGPLFWNPIGLNHWKLRPRARSRCHWACPYALAMLLPWDRYRNAVPATNPSVICVQLILLDTPEGIIMCKKNEHLHPVLYSHPGTIAWGCSFISFLSWVLYVENVQAVPLHPWLWLQFHVLNLLPCSKVLYRSMPHCHLIFHYFANLKSSEAYLALSWLFWWVMYDLSCCI